MSGIESRIRGHAGDEFESESLKCIASQHGHAFSVNFMTSGHAAPEVIIVHARKIIVDKRVSVQALHRTGRGHGCRQITPTGFGRSETEHGPQALAASKKAVPHGLVQGGWPGFSRGDSLVKGRLDRRTPAGQVGFEI
jgi:hypothetical protein